MEQSGILVVPISYTKSEDEILKELKKVNALYIPGDSETSVNNDLYQKAFKTVLEFFQESNERNKEYFPMFVMGKSIHSLIRQIGLSSSLF